jgi:antitoxin component of RelBE/YafQ-DinJ toxin-antitoxin module
MTVANDVDLWVSAKVDQALFDHVGELATRLNVTRSHVVRAVLRQTTVERVLGDLRTEASRALVGAV